MTGVILADPPCTSLIEIVPNCGLSYKRDPTIRPKIKRPKITWPKSYGRKSISRKYYNVLKIVLTIYF